MRNGREFQSARLSIVAAALVTLVSLDAAAAPCFRPWDEPRCDSYPVTEASASATVLSSGLRGELQFTTSLGWLFELDRPWAVGPIATYGYETESGTLARLGARVRRRLAARAHLDLTPSVQIVHLDRAAQRAVGGSVGVAVGWADWIAVGTRVELVRGNGNTASSMHLSLRVGSYVGLAIGPTSVLLAFILENVPITS